MAYLVYKINVNYEDHSHGKVVSSSQTFSRNKDEGFESFFKRIEQWRYDNGYVLKTELHPDNCTSHSSEE